MNYTDLKTGFTGDRRWVYSLSQPMTSDQTGQVFSFQDDANFIGGQYLCTNYLPPGSIYPSVDGAVGMALLDRNPLKSQGDQTATGGKAYTRLAAPKPGMLETTWVFDGNSIVQYYSAFPTTERFASKCLRAFDLFEKSGNEPTNTNKIYDFGVSGQTWAQMLTDFDSQVLPLLGPGAVVFAFEDSNALFVVDAATAFAQRTQYCAKVRAAGAKVITFDPLPRSGDPALVALYESRRQTLLGIIDLHPEICDANVRLRDDVRVGVPGANNNPAFFHSDKIHPVNAGHDVINEATVGAVRGLYAPSSGSGSVGGGATVEEIVALLAPLARTSEVAAVGTAVSGMPGAILANTNNKLTVPPTAAAVAAATATAVVTKSEFIDVRAKVTEADLRAKDGEKQFVDGSYQRTRNGVPQGERVFSTDGDGNRLVSDEVAP